MGENIVGIFDGVLRHIIIKREVDAMGGFAFDSQQRKMSTTKHSLLETRESMFSSGETISKEYLYPSYCGDAQEIREVYADKNIGIFQKIDCLSQIGPDQVYNILLNGGIFAQAVVEEGKIKRIIAQDEYGIYRELHGFPRKARNMIMDVVDKTIKLMEEKQPEFDEIKEWEDDKKRRRCL